VGEETTIATRPPDWAEEAGLSYRKLDYWTRQGWLRPLQEYAGPGFPRSWPENERAIALLMGRLVDAGVTPATAALAARRFEAMRGRGGALVRLEIAEGISLEIER